MNEPESWETDEGSKRSGRVNLALEEQEGNTDKNEINFDYMLDYRRRWHRIESLGVLEYDTSSEEKTTDKWSLQIKYSRLFHGLWYAAGWVLAGHDQLADQRLRVGVAATLGYRICLGAVRNLRTELGGGYITEDFYSEPDRDYWGPLWYLDNDQLVWQDQLQLHQTHRTFLALDDTNKQLWRSWTSIRVPLVSGFVGGVEYEIE